MALVLVSYDVSGISIVTGDEPADPQTPIADPVQTGHVTNRPFIVAAGFYCYGLLGNGCTPLWQLVQAVDGEQTTIAFQKTGP